MIELQEFNRLRSSLKARKEHASLLEDFREFDRARLDLEEGGGSVEQGLLKEHAAISRSSGQEIQKTNRDNRHQLDFSHCTGTKPFAVVEEEYEEITSELSKEQPESNEILVRLDAQQKALEEAQLTDTNSFWI